MNLSNAEQALTEDKLKSMEATLWKAYRRNKVDETVFKSLVEFYLPLVVKITRKMVFRSGYQMDANELLGAGVIGLYDAIQRFEDGKDCTFSHFAGIRIRGAVLDELRKRQRSAVRKLHKVEEELQRVNKRKPTHAEISVAAEMSLNEVDSYFNIDGATLSLNTEFAEGLFYIDTIADERGQQPDEVADYNFLVTHLKKNIKLLPPKEQQLLYFRYYEELSVKEIAEVFGVSLGRVSQMFKEAIYKLKHLMAETEKSKGG